jgi:hypothetical protein
MTDVRECIQAHLDLLLRVLGFRAAPVVQIVEQHEGTGGVIDCFATDGRKHPFP